MAKRVADKRRVGAALPSRSRPSKSVEWGRHPVPDAGSERTHLGLGAGGLQPGGSATEQCNRPQQTTSASLRVRISRPAAAANAGHFVLQSWRPHSRADRQRRGGGMENLPDSVTRVAEAADALGVALRATSDCSLIPGRTRRQFQSNTLDHLSLAKRWTSGRRHERCAILLREAVLLAEAAAEDGSRRSLS